MESRHTVYSHTIPPGWRLVATAVAHPDDRWVRGDLCRFEATGIYRLHRWGSLVSVPQPWARALEVTVARVDVELEALRAGRA